MVQSPATHPSTAPRTCAVDWSYATRATKHRHWHESCTAVQVELDVQDVWVDATMDGHVASVLCSQCTATLTACGSDSRGIPYGTR